VPDFDAVNMATTALQSYITCGCSDGGANLQRQRQDKKCSSTEHFKLQRAAPAQTTFTHFYIFKKIKYSNKSLIK
jgi:hypothetical protein